MNRLKKLIINEHQEYLAEKIIKNGNNIKLIGTVDEHSNNIGDLLFPNISNMNDFKLAEGQEWDIEVDEITQLKISQAEQFETILQLLGGMM